MSTVTGCSFLLVQVFLVAEPMQLFLGSSGGELCGRELRWYDDGSNFFWHLNRTDEIKQNYYKKTGRGDLRTTDQ